MALLTASLAVAALLPRAAGRGRKNQKPKPPARSATRKPAAGEGYVPLDWDTLEPIPPVQSAEGTPVGAAEGSEQRRLLPMLGMPADFMTSHWQQRSVYARRVDPRLTKLMNGFEDLEKVINANKFELGVDAKFALVRPASTVPLLNLTHPILPPCSFSLPLPSTTWSRAVK